MSDYCRVSEALYVGLCGYIGTPTEVTARREVMDMEEMIKKPVEIHKGQRNTTSGSYREGFRFESSDIDTMYWFTNHKVISDLSQFSVHDLSYSKHAIILMEDTNTAPGFVRLQLLTPTRDKIIESSIVQFNDGMYISNVKWRQIAFTLMSNDKSINNARTHGPCVNGFFRGLERDYVVCLHSSYCSRLISDLRERCSLFTWPSNTVFDDILRNGCHFVSVGNKIAGDENELDWRVSFSQAEQNLVYSMNHTQFLCYGLLKIFLKEVVNRDTEEPFVCSYFVKTVMFLMIQIGRITWCPNNLLDCFWKCFKFLLYCVNRGVLPNFFIPQNNMFASKLSTVRGARTRECLLEQLNGYNEMGVVCLLLSPKVRAMVEPIICKNLVRMEPLLVHKKSAADTDACIIKEIFSSPEFSSKYIRRHFLFLRFIFGLFNQSHTEYQTLTLQRCMASVLVEAAFIYLNISTDITNKKAYRRHRLISNLLKLAGRVGDVSCLLYLAMYYYRTCRYKEALQVTALVKSRLAQPYTLHNVINVLDRERYDRSAAGWPLSKRLKKAWAYYVCLSYNVTYYIQELVLEQKVGIENGTQILYISPKVLTDMLSVLCNHRLGNGSEYQQSLTDLETLLLHDVGRYVPLEIRDLSWQILGICKHAVGDLHGALQSYQQSLSQIPFHKIQNASKYRIELVLNQLNQ